jgi:hypothetical protein
MKNHIIILTSIFILCATLAYSQSPYTGGMKKEERKSKNTGSQYHMMMYEKAEEEAQDKYAIITEEPEDKKNPQAEVTDKSSEEKEGKQEK